MGRRKGRLEEVLSRALYADDVDLYTVLYRDLDVAKEVGLREFLLASEGFQVIPASRILEVRRDGLTIYRRRGRGALTSDPIEGLDAQQQEELVHDGPE